MYIYIFLITFLIPIDWFSPTGELLREFGSKPVSIFLTMTGMYGFFYNRKDSKSLKNIFYIFEMLLVCGTTAYLINLWLGWSADTIFHSRNKQFFLQTLLLMACFVSIIGNARLFSNYSIVEKWIKILPIAAGIHLFFFICQYFEIFNQGFWNFFHLGSSSLRPTGLTSEPSYFGTLSALLGTPLLFNKNKRFLSIFVVISLYLCSIFIFSRTFYFIVAVQCGYIGIVASGKKIKQFIISVFILILLFNIFISYRGIESLDVNENLSSSMRIGSTVIATNVALKGYALSGIGIGQFNFFYRPEFAPNFIFNSNEALQYMNNSIERRASTFNFYIRIFLEMGIVGFIFFMYFIFNLFKMRCAHDIQIKLFFVGSLTFLFTQDSYYYPPFVLASSLIIGGYLRRLSCNIEHVEHE